MKKIITDLRIRNTIAIIFPVIHKQGLICLSYTLIYLLFINISLAQSRPDQLSLKDRILPVSEKHFFKTEGYYNWCPSMIKTKDGLYHLFYSAWKKEYGFGGWLTRCEIAHATSRQATGPWTIVGTVLKGAGKGHWDAITAHNPKIKYFEGKYYLYYISTNLGDKDYTETELTQTGQTFYSHPNWAILRKNQRTGVAVSDNINGPYKRMDQPLIEPSGPITTLTVNPAITQGKNGKYFLIVKGDKPNETRFIRNQAIAIGDHPSGPFTIQPKPVIDYIDTEDMSMWYDKKRDYYYGVFHSTSGFIGLVSSPDGLNWYKAKDYNLMPKQLLMASGGIQKYDRIERPFIYTENGEPKVLSLALKKGDDSFIVFIPLV
ncbi:glycoside hydrolase family protein [Niabella insulamsoli]|uniref:glycoside hydrolase family protein n=1 Tax=Niabella insulamsoli TaxID=3144874 RepID=UPI0031FDB9A3